VGEAGGQRGDGAERRANLKSVPLNFWSDPVSDAAEGELLARLRQVGG